MQRSWKPCLPLETVGGLQRFGNRRQESRSRG